MSDSDENPFFIGGSGPNPFSAGGLGGFTGAAARNRFDEDESSDEDERPAKRTKLFTGGHAGMKFVKTETIQPKEIPQPAVHQTPKDSPSSDDSDADDVKMEAPPPATTKGLGGGQTPGRADESDDDAIDPRFQFDSAAAERKRAEITSGSVAGAASNIGPQMPSRIHRSDGQLADDFSNPVLAYMKKMGWKGGGLGKEEQGRANPLKGAYGRRKNQAIQEEGEAAQEDDDKKKPDTRSAQDILLGRGGGAGRSLSSSKPVRVGGIVNKNASTRDVIPGLGTHMTRRDRLGADIGDPRDEPKGRPRADRVDYYEDEATGELIPHPATAGASSTKQQTKSTIRIIDMTQAGGARLVGSNNLADSLLEKSDRPLDELLRNLSRMVLRADEDVDMLRQQVRDYRASLDVLHDDGARRNGDGPFSPTSDSESASMWSKNSGSDVDMVVGEHGRRDGRRLVRGRNNEDADDLDAAIAELENEGLDAKANGHPRGARRGGNAANLGPTRNYTEGGSAASSAGRGRNSFFDEKRKSGRFGESPRGRGKRKFAAFTSCDAAGRLKQLELVESIVEELEEQFGGGQQKRRSAGGTGGTASSGDKNSLAHAAGPVLQVVRYFEDLRKQYGRRFLEEHGLLLLCAEHLLTPLRNLVNRWDALDEPDELDEVLGRIRSVLVPKTMKPHPASTQRKTEHLLDKSQPYVLLMQQTVYPRVRNAVGSADFKPAASPASCGDCLLLLSTATSFLPSFCVNNLGRMNLLPKLREAAHKWDERGASFPPHAWLLAFKEYVPWTDLCEVASLVKKAVGRFLQTHWRPLDGVQLLPASGHETRQTLVEKNVGVGMLAGLRRFLTADDVYDLEERVVERLRASIQPDDSDEVLRALAPWLGESPGSGIFLVVDELFFTPLRQNAKRMLQAKSADELTRAAVIRPILQRQYRRVRAYFPDAALAASPDLAHQFAYLLEVFQAHVADRRNACGASAYALEPDGLETGPQLQNAAQKLQAGAKDHRQKPRSEREKTLLRYAEMVREEKERAQRTAADRSHMEEPGMGLREILEHVAAERGLKFQKKPGFLSQSGNQWYAFGDRLFVYWEHDVVFYTADLADQRRKTAPVTVEGLLKLAGR
eukprot:g4952.t1